MNLVRTLAAVISCSAIIFASGSSSGSGSSSSGSNGGSNEITGTVQQVSPSDSMLVVKTQNKMDTLYIMSQTQLTTPLNQIQKGDQVTVQYQTMDNKKIAVSVKSQSGSNGSSGSSGSSDSTNPQDTGM